MEIVGHSLFCWAFRLFVAVYVGIYNLLVFCGMCEGRTSSVKAFEIVT